MTARRRVPRRILVDAPPPDRSRDRVEARVFARLDAVRAAERADRLSADRPGGRPWVLSAIVAVAAGVTLAILATHDPSTPDVPDAVAGRAPPQAVASAPPAPGAAVMAPPVGGDERAAPVGKLPAQRSLRAAFQAAQRLEPHDRRGAARAYRAVASGDGAWAALALYSLAELEASSGRRRDALAAVDEYLRRFPRGAGVEDVLWIRVETLRALGRQEEAQRAAASYLRQFPRGTYVRPAARVAAPP